MPQPFPTRRAFAWLAIGVMAFTVYASLLPFAFEQMPLGAAWSQFRSVMLTPSFGRVPRANFIANILLFLPVGFGLTGALLVDGSRRVTAIATGVTIALSLAVSLAVEFLQLFTPGRVSTLADVLAQTIGCIAGIAAWVFTGPELTRWLRDASGRTRGDRLARALAGYAAAWIFVSLAPFDITLDPAVLARRVRTGMIMLVPFAGAGLSTATVTWDALATTISTAPLGMLALVGWTGRGARRSAGTAFALGAMLVVVLEVAQIVIRSHAASTTDLLFGWSGVAIGVGIGARMGGRHVMRSAASRSTTGWALAALGTWCVILCAYHWLPYNFAIDPVALQRKVGRMSLLPFVGYQAGSDLNAFNNLLVKLGLSMPVGVIGAFVVRSWGGSSRILIAGWLMATVVIFSVVESGQLFLPSRSPDPTDVLVGVAGACAGLSLGRWLRMERGGGQIPTGESLP